jgi:hypothetical protein
VRRADGLRLGRAALAQVDDHDCEEEAEEEEPERGLADEPAQRITVRASPA